MDLKSIKLSQDTKLQYSGVLVNGDTLRPEAPPLYAATAFMLEDVDRQIDINDNGGYSYGRGTNPTRDALAELVTCSEEGEKTLLCSSGMAAISSTLLTFLKSGDHVIANSDLYGETIDFLTNYMKEFGVETTFVPFTELEAIKKAVKPNTKLLYSEVISNPLTAVVDIDAVAQIAHAAGALYCIDSTFTTPFVVQPLKHGADIVIHSLTKYYNGHSDASGGSITGRSELLDKILPLMLLLGCSLDPYSSWMILRGTRTMGMRVRKQNENAKLLAKYLVSSPYVSKVYHPSLPDHKQYELAKRLFSDGYGGAIVTVSLPDDMKKLNEFIHRMHFVTYLPTLGGYNTSLSHPVNSSHHDVPEPVRLKMGIHDGMLRISVGTEDINDLINDFENALLVYKD